jgi:hypothetical protein
MDLVGGVGVGAAGGGRRRDEDALEPSAVPTEDGQGQDLVPAEGFGLAGVEIDQRQVERFRRSRGPDCT